MGHSGMVLHTFISKNISRCMPPSVLYVTFLAFLHNMKKLVIVHILK